MLKFIIIVTTRKEYFMSLKDFKDNAKDYLDQIRSMPYEAKRGAIIVAVCGALMVVPLIAMHHYTTLADHNTRVVQVNKAEARDLIKHASGQQKYAKMRLKNQKQTQAEIDHNVKTFIKAQKVLMNYQIKNTTVTNDEHDEALQQTRKLITQYNILGDPDDGLMIFSNDATDLKITTSMSSSYSIFQKDIHIVFHLSYQNKPVYIVDSTYNIKDQVFTTFTPYSTTYTFAWENGVKLEDQKKAKIDKKKDKNLRKMPKAKPVKKGKKPNKAKKAKTPVKKEGKK